ncbi:hypothetical protein Zmor_002384 [Zophobas morio]|uniref:Odorant receptor n=1 Tax=Zophobas morio TaxID=2755281 RepID=A0AA38MU16_9CUCU|nr:hypothetical protein Zmor_002384 [Zophobas morio]
MENARYSFSLNISVMKLIGFYPSDTYPCVHKIYAVIVYLILMLPPTILGPLRFVLAQEVTSFDYNDFMMVGMIFYTFKFLPFVKNGEKFKKCIHYFDEFYGSVVHDQHKKIIQECVNVCQRNSRVFFVGCIGGIVGFMGQLLTREDPTQLLVNVWLPDFVMKSRVLYYHVYVILILGLVYASFACGTIDPLIGGLAHQATAQLQVLKDNLENLGRHSKQDFLNLENIDENTKSKNIDLAIKNCIRHHQTIIDFVCEYQECFSMVVFSQFTESTLTIGLLCFQISKTLELDIYFLIAMNYLSLLFFQIFFYCYYGTLLIEESKTLPTAVYMSRWYEYNIQTKRTLNILMERSKRPMVVRAGKLFDLSLDTFTTVLKRAYSFVAVLRNY